VFNVGGVASRLITTDKTQHCCVPVAMIVHVNFMPDVSWFTSWVSQPFAPVPAGVENTSVTSLVYQPLLHGEPLQVAVICWVSACEPAGRANPAKPTRRATRVSLIAPPPAQPAQGTPR
jgi:hypothetical protein